MVNKEPSLRSEKALGVCGIFTHMVKHFEELWEEAEQVSSKKEIPDIQQQLHTEIDKLFSKEDLGYSFGRILYLLCYLSLKWNVNTFAALLKETQDHKLDSMEDED